MTRSFPAGPGLLLLAVSAFGLPTLAGPADPGLPDDVGPFTAVQEAFLADREPPQSLSPEHETPCAGGFAGAYPCENVDLMEFLPLTSIGGGSGNDVWGWTDPSTGKEYALMGRSNGTAFVDVSDPAASIYLGNLPTHSGNSTWRDIKVYQNHAFIVSEATNHGLQVFDLTQLRNVVNPPVTFTETAFYGHFGRAHNIAINEQTGFAYAVGSRQGTETCGAGLHMVNIQNPTAPTFAGCFSSDGYTHDTQCVIYDGPDTAHVGKEICFNSNEDTLTIVDVTNKSAPAQISRTAYSASGYTHQGWLTEDQRYFLLDDELDEQNFGHNTRTRIWDLADLEAPSVIGFFSSPVGAIDHNQYVKGNFVYQANYRGGLRILSLDDIESGTLTQAGFFDIYPASDTASFNGAWSVYPFFASGNVLISGIEQGLFVVRPQLCVASGAPSAPSAVANGNNRIDVSWTAPAGATGVTYTVLRSFGGCPGSGFEPVATDLAGTSFEDTTVSGTVTYSYQVVAVDATGLCSSPPSACADATATGVCNAAPAFAGASSATSLGTFGCAIDVAWPAASPNCGPSATYSVYRSTLPDFVPAVANRIAADLTGTTYRDRGVAPGVAEHYVVRSVDPSNLAEDGNLVRVTATPTGPPGPGTWAAGAELGDPGMDFETVVTEHVGWHLEPTRKHSGVRSYYSSEAQGQCIGVMTPPLELAVTGTPTLSFWTLFDHAPGVDGGVVELSVDEGLSWQTLSLSPPYPGTFSGTTNGCGDAAGAPAFTGSQPTWSQYSADLSAWAGQTVRVRFRFSAGTGGAEGWYVDDLTLTQALVPTVCVEGGLFTDDFETGDTSAWSLVVP
ncbi:MAG TPA: choice-of-anchor B family protein [Thermoanaerobaculia bacterium]|nr:choice-of-anchor B family protein [Thermoanaerobaculia bacterium]